MATLAKLSHARAIGYCAQGMRRWFAGKEYSWEQFVTVGVPVAWLRSHHDALVDAVADEAERQP